MEPCLPCLTRTYQVSSHQIYFQLHNSSRLPAGARLLFVSEYGFIILKWQANLTLARAFQDRCMRWKCRIIVSVCFETLATITAVLVTSWPHCLCFNCDTVIPDFRNSFCGVQRYRTSSNLCTPHMPLIIWLCCISYFFKDRLMSFLNIYIYCMSICFLPQICLCSTKVMF